MGWNAEFHFLAYDGIRRRVGGGGKWKDPACSHLVRGLVVFGPQLCGFLWLSMEQTTVRFHASSCVGPFLVHLVRSLDSLRPGGIRHSRSTSITPAGCPASFSSPRASVVRMAWLLPSLRGLELRYQDSLCPRDREPRGVVNERPWEAPCQLLQACIRFRPFTTLGPWLSFRVIPSFLDRNQGVLRNPFSPFKRFPFERAGRSLSQRDVWGKRPIRRHHNGHGRDGDAQWRTFAASQRPQRTRDARESGQDGRGTSSGGGGGQWSRRTGVPSCT